MNVFAQLHQSAGDVMCNMYFLINSYYFILYSLSFVYLLLSIIINRFWKVCFWNTAKQPMWCLCPIYTMCWFIKSVSIYPTLTCLHTIQKCMQKRNGSGPADAMCSACTSTSEMCCSSDNMSRHRLHFNPRFIWGMCESALGVWCVRIMYSLCIIVCMPSICEGGSLSHTSASHSGPWLAPDNCTIYQ